VEVIIDPIGCPQHLLLGTLQQLTQLQIMQRVSSASIARSSRSLGSVAAAAAPPSPASFSTFLGTVNTNTLGFLQEKLLTHDSDSRRRGASKKQSANGEGVVPVSRDLHRNIFFNSNEQSALRHVELTKDFIRLEFSEPNEEYRKHADILFASEAERRAQGVPQWLVPVALHNNSHCGGGATILLDKHNVYESLRHRARGRTTSQHVARH
jgi:hypothetical protein